MLHVMVPQLVFALQQLTLLSIGGNVPLTDLTTTIKQQQQQHVGVPR